MPHFRGSRHDFKKPFIEIRYIEVVPAIPEGIFCHDVVGGGIEK